MKIALILMSLIVTGTAFAQHGAPATPPPAAGDQGAMHEEKPADAPAKKEHKKKKKAKKEAK